MKKVAAERSKGKAIRALRGWKQAAFSRGIGKKKKGIMLSAPN